MPRDERPHEGIEVAPAKVDDAAVFAACAARSTATLLRALADLNIRTAHLQEGFRESDR